MFQQAWDLLPEPAVQWEAATWILAALGDVYFLSGDYEAARAYLQEGKAIFDGEDPKCLDFVKGKLRPPEGGWPEGW